MGHRKTRKFHPRVITWSQRVFSGFASTVIVATIVIFLSGAGGEETRPKNIEPHFYIHSEEEWDLPVSDPVWRDSEEIEYWSLHRGVPFAKNSIEHFVFGERIHDDLVADLMFQRRVLRRIHHSGDQRLPIHVHLGLDWLARQQCDYGSFTAEGADQSMSKVKITALAALAFMGAGVNTQRGPYSDELREALVWLVDQMNAEGRVGQGALDEQAIAGIAFAEAHLMTGSALTAHAQAQSLQYLQRVVSVDSRGPASDFVSKDLAWCGYCVALSKVIEGKSSDEFCWLHKIPRDARPSHPSGIDDPELMFLHGMTMRYGSDTRWRSWWWEMKSHALVMQHDGLWSKIEDPDTGSWNPSGRWSVGANRLITTTFMLLCLETNSRYLDIDTTLR